jgi:hypothetical protein
LQIAFLALKVFLEGLLSALLSILSYNHV